jgi:ribonuclease HI
MNMAMAIHTARDISGQTPTSEKVWSAIRDRDTPKNIRGFLWKCLHGTYKIGEFWEKIPQFEQRGTCNICGTPETMEYILLECNVTPQETVWKAAQELWCKREASWPRIRFGTILGCNLAMFRDDNGKKLIGKSRLFKIIVLDK